MTRHEMYTQLFKFWDFQWVHMATDWHAAAGGQRIDVSTYYRCTKLVQRFWRAQADAYALLQGIWYGATQARQADVSCA